MSRGGSLFARVVLGLRPNDLTGGFKAWRATTLAAVPFDGVHAGGYVFQIEMTFRASRAGARIREVPITFRDRRVGQSKMSRRIVVEALVVVVQLRVEEILGRLRRRSPRVVTGPSGACRAVASGTSRGRPSPGVRVVLDARPLQAPDRAPLAAAYLDGLLGAFDAEPLAGRVVRLPDRRPMSTTRPSGSRISRSSAGASCRRPACCGPAR